MSRQADGGWVAGTVLVLLALALSPSRLAGQQPGSAESERQKVEARLAETAGRERLDLLIELVHQYVGRDPVSATAWGSEASEMLGEWGDDERRWKLLQMLGWAQYLAADFEAGMRSAEDLESLARAREDQMVLLSALRLKSELQEEDGDVIGALKTLQEALGLAEGLDEGDSLGAVLIALGTLYDDLENLEQSLEYYTQAYRWFEERDVPLGEATASANIGVMCGRLGRYDEAFEYFERSLELFREHSGDQRRVAVVLGYLAKAYRDSGDAARALEIHQESWEIFDELGLDRERTAALSEIGRDHHAMGETEQAETFYRRALESWDAIEEPRHAAEMLVALGKLERARGRLEAAHGLVERAVDLYTTGLDAAGLDATRQDAQDAKAKTEIDQGLEEALLELAEIYNALGRSDEALDAFRRHQVMLVARLEEEKSRNLAEMQVRFNVDRKEREIQFLQQGRRTLIAVFGLVLVVVVLIFNRWRLKNRESLMRQTVEQERAVSAQLREIDKLKDEFLANTSHELRTPLYGITGLAESLIDGAAGEVPKAVKANLSMIVGSGRRLSHLVNDILDFSKLRHKSLKIDPQPVDLRSLTEVVLTVCRPLVGSNDLELRNAVAADLPAAEADENRLQQILYNLVGQRDQVHRIGVGRGVGVG